MQHTCCFDVGLLHASIGAVQCMLNMHTVGCVAIGLAPHDRVRTMLIVCRMQAMQLKAELLHGCTVSGLLRNQRRSFTGLLSSVRVVPKQGEADHGTCHHRHTISGLDGFEFGLARCSAICIHSYLYTCMHLHLYIYICKYIRFNSIYVMKTATGPHLM